MSPLLESLRGIKRSVSLDLYLERTYFCSEVLKLNLTIDTIYVNVLVGTKTSKVTESTENHMCKGICTKLRQVGRTYFLIMVVVRLYHIWSR